MRPSVPEVRLGILRGRERAPRPYDRDRPGGPSPAREREEVRLPSPLVFFHIATPDPEGARRFYAEVFDWTFDDASTNGGANVGIDPGGPGDFDVHGTLRALPAGAAPAVTLWFRVADLRATVPRAEAAGAKVLVPIRQQGPGGAHIALVRAPDGQAVGIVQA